MKKNLAIILLLIILVVSCGCTNPLSNLKPTVTSSVSTYTPGKTSTPHPIKTASPYSMVDAYAEIGIWNGDSRMGLAHEYLWTIWVINRGVSTEVRCNDGIITTLYHDNKAILENTLAIGNFAIPPGKAVTTETDTYGAVDELTDDPSNEHLILTIDCKNNGKIERHLTTGPLPSWKELPSWYGNTIPHYGVSFKAV